MRMMSRYVLSVIAACSFTGVSLAQDEEGAPAAEEAAAPEPAPEEQAAPPAEEPAPQGEDVQQNDSGAATHKATMGTHATNTNGTTNTPVMTTQVQEALNRAGAALKVDGKFGNSTKVAIKNFQKKNKLKVTGQLDEPTKKMLGINR